MSIKKRKLQKQKKKKLQKQREKSPRNLLKQIDKTISHYLWELPKHIDTSYGDRDISASRTKFLQYINLFFLPDSSFIKQSLYYGITPV